MQHITSRQNERVKEAAKLRQARQRARQGRFLIDGRRQIIRALDAGIQLDEAFVCQSLVDSEEEQGIAGRVLDSADNAATVSEEVYAKLAFGDLEDGLVVVAQSPERRLGDLKLPAQPLVAVLEGLEKPGNVGAILRTADAAGLDAVVVAEPVLLGACGGGV